MKKLTQGLRTDESPNDQPLQSWRDARNIVDGFNKIKNERGFDNITPLNYPDKTLIGVIETNTKKVLFFATNVVAESEIGILDEDDLYTPVIIDTVLNFDTAHPIQGTFEYKFNDNLIIAWTDSTNGKWNPYRILNLNCIPFGIEVDYSITPADIDKAKALLSLFPNVKAPNLDDFTLLESGGNLTTGVYYPIVAYTGADNSDTSWLQIFNPISIVADSKGNFSLNYDGDQGGLPTGKSLNFEFIDIDTNFKYLKFGYVKLENGVYSAYYVNSYLINGTTLTFDFTNNENSKELITLDEVLIPNSIYPYGKTITSLLNKLFIANLETDPEYDFQPYVNNIELKWVYEQDVKIFEPLVSESQKHEKVIYFNKGFKSDEVYAFYIALKSKITGKWTKAFTIPGRLSNANDTLDISGTDVNIAELDAGNPIPAFRILDSSPTLGLVSVPDPNKPANANNIEGSFGYWENENETYPDLDSFNSVPVGGIDNRGQKVRHHKFPSTNSLINSQPGVNNNGFNYTQNRDALTFNTTFVNAGYIYSLILNNTTNEIGWLNGSIGQFSVQPDGTFLYFGDVRHNQIFYFLKNKIKVKIHFKLTFAASAAGLQLNFTIWKNGVNYYNKNEFIPPGGGVVQIYAEFDIQDTYQTGFAFGAGFLENYTILMDASLSATAPVITSCIGDLNLYDLERSTVETKILGIKVSNFEIPTGLEEIYDEWGVFYAKRTSNNIRALGNDVLRAKRFHTFDLMQKQVATKASYLKTQLEFFDNNIGSILGGFPYVERDLLFDYTRPVTSKIHHIRRFEYAGENTNLNGINNTGLASNIYIEAGKDLTTPYDLSDLHTAIGLKNILIDLMIYKKDMYNSFQNQELVFTGFKFKTTAGVQASQKVYGGDIFNNYHGFTEAYDLGSALQEWSIPVESASNIGLRMDDLETGKYYYPKHLHYEAVKPTVSFYGYNNDYSALNDLEKVFPATYENNCLVDVTVFKERVAYSITDGNESSNINWRIFKTNDYYEMPKNRGVIWNILGHDRTLFIHHQYSLFIAQIKDRLNTSGEETFLGISDLFDRPPEEVLPIKNGHAGTSSQFAIIVCEAGYCFIDRERGRGFIFNGKLNEFTAEGNFVFWEDNAQQSDPTLDNPFIGMGYTMCYDDSEKRLIITKKDTGIGAFPFTASFNTEKNYLICFHDYLPYYMFSTRQGIYIADNIGSQIYKHNSQVNVATYFDGDVFPSYIDVVFNENDEYSKRLQSAVWISEVEDATGVILDQETITQIMVYNSNQVSGLLETKTNNLWFNKDAKNKEETWYFNNFRDLILDKTLPFLNKDGSLITGNINTAPLWFNKSLFLSKFAIVRFQYDNLDQNYISILKVGVNNNISTR